MVLAMMVRSPPVVGDFTEGVARLVRAARHAMGRRELCRQRTVRFPAKLAAITAPPRPSLAARRSIGIRREISRTTNVLLVGVDGAGSSRARAALRFHLRGEAAFVDAVAPRAADTSTVLAARLGLGIGV